MDVLRFVNSKDIRKHLEEIKYEFSSLEAAWLIYQCRDATIKEKHQAWKELIETMPDCRIEERMGTIPQDSLHGFLESYMKIENELINEFYDDHHADTYDDNKPYVYKFEYIYENGTEYDWETVFSTIDALWESIMEPEEDVVGIICTRMQIDRLDSCQIAYLNPSFDIMNFNPGRMDNNEYCDIYWGVFEGLWFDFPTPFKKGDIVWDPNRPEGTCAGPFVTTGVCLDGVKKEAVNNRIRKDGDTTDMFAGGYFLNDDGSVYQECMSNYMDLEFYEKELTSSKRTLIALSRYLKGEIDTLLFAKAYHQIITKGYAEDSVPLDDLKQNLILAGITIPEEKE